MKFNLKVDIDQPMIQNNKIKKSFKANNMNSIVSTLHESEN